MTSDRLDRILTLLAAAQVSAVEFRGIIAEISAAHHSVIEQRYARIRSAMKRIADVDTSDDVAIPNDDPGKRVRDDVLSFAREGAANAGDAAERLRSRLLKMDSRLELPPFSPKEGFNRWLERAIRLASPNVVLNAAIAEFSGSNARESDGWRLSDL